MNFGRLMQKILHELNVVNIVVSLLQLPFQKGIDINQLLDIRFKPLVELLNLMYRLLKQMAKDNLRNARSIHSHLQVFRYSDRVPVFW